MKFITIIAIAVTVCIARAHDDQCVYHDPETGVGHVAYSESLPLFDVRYEAVNECEAVHGEEQCESFCFMSREGE